MTSFKDTDASFSEFAFIGLLKTAQCLFQELDDFRKSLSGSAEENILWQQCEKRLQEIETYRDMLPEEISDLAMIHASRCHAAKREKRYELDGRYK